MKSVLIISVTPVIPTKGSNAGKEMFVINGKYWAKSAPADNDTHVCVDDVVAEITPADGATPAVTKNYENVIGYGKDVRMSIDAKIKLLTSHDAGYSMAIATLLK